MLEFNDTNVFENVARRTSVIVCVKTINEKYSIGVFGNPTGSRIAVQNRVEKDLWLQQARASFLIAANDKDSGLLEKLEKTAARFGNYFYVNYGAQVSSKVKGKFGKKEVVGLKKVGRARQFYEGKDVHRWHLRYRDLWLDYRHEELYGPRAPALFENEKIVVRKISDTGHRLAGTLDLSMRYTDDGNVLCVPYGLLKNTPLQADFKGYEIMDSVVDLRFATALLLSKLQSFYFFRRFATESLQGGTSHTYPTSVRGLLLKVSAIRDQEPIIALYEKIIAISGTPGYLGSEPMKKCVSNLESELDRLIYKLFDLDAKEIGFVEAHAHGK